MKKENKYKELPFDLEEAAKWTMMHEVNSNNRTLMNLERSKNGWYEREEWKEICRKPSKFVPGMSLKLRRIM